MAQSLANAAMNLRHGDLEREQRKQLNQTVEYLKSKGYNEEEASVMTRNPQILSALFTSGDAPKLSQGFQWYDNPETGEREMRPIKGSPQELEYEQKKAEIEGIEKNKRNAVLKAKEEINLAMGAVHDALNIIERNPNWAAGRGGYIAQLLPASDAKTLKNKFTQLQGGIFKRVIAGIKEQSKNGTMGVGPLSDTESKWLVSSYGALDVGEKPEELHKTLSNIKEMFRLFEKLSDEEIYNLSEGIKIKQRPKSSSDNMRNAVTAENGQNSTDYLMLPEKYAGVSVITTNEAVQNLPKGSKFAFHTQDGIRIYER
ncbi:hypothetical protein [Bartonella gliris]|uniref:hypothetical protein n=1 Tax=Bartonella gliris TaxID=3004109 RepID=UPI0038735EB6